MSLTSGIFSTVSYETPTAYRPGYVEDYHSYLFKGPEIPAAFAWLLVLRYGLPITKVRAHIAGFPQAK